MSNTRAILTGRVSSNQKKLDHIKKQIQKEKNAEQEKEEVPFNAIKQHTQIEFVRASGPGGQNVNKANSKASSRFHIDSARFLSRDLKKRLRKLAKRHINNADEIVIRVDDSRDATYNRTIALQRMDDLIQEAAIIPVVVEKHEKIRTDAAERKRLMVKKKNMKKFEQMLQNESV
eukprot:CAMPEP_0117434082 /NCGR_PEP_ID=MMETSP0758-20121206/13370_1 /TAXON_ID=63605 /ORGANISM="Percolomonas cosmopolitus, Strain AE-1 (ATCC 50343)" /LENGTH=174 /DNA_ID=CAMNT_0005225243 /DNA_START=63 /DNA_END=587 /DNA_ORIENTATION=+